MWTIRIRAPKGMATLSGVNPEQPAINFLQTLSEQTGISADKQELLTGFPPKPIQIPDAQTPLRSVGLANGDSITVRETATSVLLGTSSSAAPLNAIPAPAAPQPAASTKPETGAAAPQPSSVPKPATLQSAPKPKPSRQPPSVAPNARSAPSQQHEQPTQQFQQQPPAAISTADEDAELAAAIAASLAECSPRTQQAAAAATSTPSRSPARSHPAIPSSSAPAPAAGNTAAVTSIPLPDGSCVVRRIIDSDNSCLFNAVGYVMEHSRSKARQLRSVIAAVVAGDPVTYNEGFLGKDNEEYCKWIQQADKWGGAIELSILASHYGREIAAYDIQTKRCDVYGQGSGYSERAMLIYDGLHYDAVAVAAFEGAPEDLDITMYSTSSAEAADIARGAEKLTEAAHTARQFTDTATFTLRCGCCQLGLKGQKEAVEHAMSTGHTNFTEY